jgi:hypothetical protein
LSPKLRDDIVNVNSDVKLQLIKVVVGVPLRLLDKVLSFPKEPHYPQTIMLLNAYAMLRKVYRLEVLEGTFTEKNGKPDGNLERFLSVSMKVLSQVSERDRYYRAWVGLFLIMADNQVRVMTADPAELKRWIREQWDTPADVVPDPLMARFARDFQEVALCDYLGNLARMPVAKQRRSG